jgi:hypothetical protein
VQRAVSRSIEIVKSRGQDFQMVCQPFAKIKSLLRSRAELHSLCPGESDGSRARCYFAVAGLEKWR